MTFPINAKLRADRREVEIDLPAEADSKLTMSAAEVDRMVNLLVSCRAAMQPQLPAEDPPGGFFAYTSERMRWFVFQDATHSERTGLAILHPGLGWVACHLDQEQWSSLIRTLQTLPPDSVTPQ